MVLPDVPQSRQPADPRYPVIEQHAIKGRSVQLGQGVVFISGSFHRVPALCEALLKEVPEIRIVIDDQKTCPQQMRFLSHSSEWCERAKDSFLRDTRTNAVTWRSDPSQ